MGLGNIGKTFGQISGGLSGGGFISGAIGGEVGKLLGDSLGDLPGLFDDKTTASSVSTVNLRNFEDLIKGQSGLAADAYDVQTGGLENLRNLLTRGGTAQIEGDIDAARSAQLSLAQMLQQAQSGPSSQNVVSAQNFANSIFAPQEQAMRQQFKQSETETSRLAARLGRQVDDPILRAKLAESQAVQMGQLGAQKGAFTAQTAQGFQNQALQMQNQLAQVRGGLATQALQNRQTLMGMGQSLLNQERQFRLNTATRTGNATQTQQGGWGDVIGAATGIAGTFMGLGK